MMSTGPAAGAICPGGRAQLPRSIRTAEVSALHRIPALGREIVLQAGVPVVPSANVFAPLVEVGVIKGLLESGFILGSVFFCCHGPTPWIRAQLLCCGPFVVSPPLFAVKEVERSLLLHSGAV